MKGIDSNVLARILVCDDRDQAKRAQASVARNAPCWINRVVLCETVWVLQRLYGFDRTQVAAALTRVLATRQFDVEDLDAIQAGIVALEQGFDFADAVIASTNRSHGCASTGTFDRKAARLDGFEAV